MGIPGFDNARTEEILNTYPDLVADALIFWRTMTLERERTEALVYLELKGQDKEKTAAELKAEVHANEKRYHAVLEELKAEGEHTRLEETLMAAKKQASLRTSF